eukprot:XP_001691536.1 predicted protein [Chlamydomonas reinhardtii]
MSSSYEAGAMCPVFRPSREEFDVPFCEYVRKVFRKHPDMPMFKVVPPKGWKPRRAPFPDLRNVQINVPIRQNAFGTRGAYRCVLVEQKPMSVAEFKVTADEEELPQHGSQKAAAGDGKEEAGEGKDPDAVDADVERSFWANLTLNPPLYGADTPVSFFDEKLPYGWNLNHLGDLLQTHPKVDAVPGVTTPMTYFGMWRSFFGWHKEDADLYSVNFLHWGAPKVWYCVPPSGKQKFERMAQSLFPELHKSCPAFVRHKDIMLSPSCLKTYGVPYMRACQRANEFVVLNAAAYHAGFNSGFNCAEAVNFGLKEWIPIGKEAVPCRCSALKDVLTADGRHIVTAIKPRSTVNMAAMALKARCDAGAGAEAVMGQPMAIVGDAENGGSISRRASAAVPLPEAASAAAAAMAVAPAGAAPVVPATAPAAAQSPAADTSKRFFYLVQRLARPAPTPGHVLLRWLKEGRDGLFRPVAGSVWEEAATALVPVHVQPVCANGASSGGAAAAAALDMVGTDGGEAPCCSGDPTSSSHSAAGANGGGEGKADAKVSEPEAWRLMTPREQIVDVELRRE